MRYAKYSCARRAASLMQSRSWSSVSNFLLGLRLSLIHLFMGLPMTGRVVLAAKAPARCAAVSYTHLTVPAEQADKALEILHGGHGEHHAHAHVEEMCIRDRYCRQR